MLCSAGLVLLEYISSKPRKLYNLNIVVNRGDFILVRKEDVIKYTRTLYRNEFRVSDKKVCLEKDTEVKEDTEK
jgi:signal transduction protein with GAF and PtsI domain